MSTSENPSPAGRVDGVLFDIDDTLVDLETAMDKTLRHVSAEHAPGLAEHEWAEYTRLYSKDPLGHYDRFLSGELSFVEQRLERIQHAQEWVHGTLLDYESMMAWNKAYERTLPVHFAPFDDVARALDALEDAGIGYGAVSNNVEEYQRIKLDKAGLRRVEVLVGTDAVGCPKPDPRIFHEGARQLGTAPERTMYVGDNLVVDAEGAEAAGLAGVWLKRPEAYGTPGPKDREYDGVTVGSLDELLPLLGLG
ncbi:HAD family hydrolase [Arthrobacter castelli]|uniref:HAD family hydrolase n=1 Tax=Arthrobacter castelli TaxID=271431 RepID=UPI000427BC9C|nr:HAD-IA family hydrolase [Arthrobacter castelli]